VRGDDHGEITLMRSCESRGLESIAVKVSTQGEPEPAAQSLLDQPSRRSRPGRFSRRTLYGDVSNPKPSKRDLLEARGVADNPLSLSTDQKECTTSFQEKGLRRKFERSQLGRAGVRQAKSARRRGSMPWRYPPSRPCSAKLDFESPPTTSKAWARLPVAAVETRLASPLCFASGGLRNEAPSSFSRGGFHSGCDLLPPTPGVAQSGEYGGCRRQQA